MPWRGHNGQICRVCDKHISEVGPLSARYKCAGCGEGRMIENHRAMLRSSGPFFEHWRRRMLAAFGVSAVDAQPDER